MLFLTTALFLTFFILSLSFFYFYIKIAYHYNLIDKPNIISMHADNVPTGSGIIISILLLFFFLLFYFINMDYTFNIPMPNRYYLLLISILTLGLIGFYDDIREIKIIYRFLSHFVIVLLSLPLFNFANSYLFDIIPAKFLLIIFLFTYVYLINIYNFLDGSDGYLTINSLIVFLAFCITFINEASLNFNFYLSFVMIPILLGYLFFNKPKAKLFMGDSGSIVVGYLVGYFFTILVLNGNWGVALAVVAYPLSDISITIIRKMKNGHNPWDRLFDYFFLRALNSKNNSHKKIFFISLIHGVLNLIVITFVVMFEYQFLCLISLFLSSVKIFLFNFMIKIRV